MIKNTKPVIVALDFTNETDCLNALEQLDPNLCRVKIGKELFTYCGPQLVKRVIAQGYDVFLDLKFHDIPNTVAGAVSAAADMGVWMVNVHASGGRAMMLAARQALSSPDAPLLIAVTILTSLGYEDILEVGLDVEPKEQVIKLAKLSEQCGLDGVVCSANEAETLRELMPSNFALVTPGIRTLEDAAGDQKRIETPASALAKGSDFLVIGRPVTQSSDPRAKLHKILQEIEQSQK